MRWLLFALLIIPALEIGVFIWVGGMIGPWWVVTLIFLSGILGVTFAKRQGVEIWLQARKTMHHKQMPGEQIIDGICLLIGAVLLLLPGFITDLMGLLLIIPYTRYPFKLSIINWIKWKMSKGTIIYRK